MSKEWMKPILEMLKDAGAVELPHGGGHLKFRLPNGNIFIDSSSPSSPLTATNALARLRRELRYTHPEIAMRGRNLSKEKMAAMVVNRPGAEAIPLGSVEYLIPDEECLPKFFVDTKPTPIRIEGSEMSSMLDRARTALGEVNLRLASYNEQINSLKIAQNADVDKQLKLEDYIDKQEAIAREATELLDFGVIPPEQPVPVLRAHSPHSGSRKTGVRMPLDVVHNRVFPYLLKITNGSGFTVDQFRNSLSVNGYGLDRKTVANWLGNEVRRPGTNIMRVSNGHYGFLFDVKEEVSHEEIPNA